MNDSLVDVAAAAIVGLAANAGTSSEVSDICSNLDAAAPSRTESLSPPRRQSHPLKDLTFFPFFYSPTSFSFQPCEAASHDQPSKKFCRSLWTLSGK